MLARMLTDVGGIPAHGNQRSEWEAGCRFDFDNPDYRCGGTAQGGPRPEHDGDIPYYPHAGVCANSCKLSQYSQKCDD
jgi:hypothetical protein